MTRFRKKGPVSQINTPLPHIKDEARQVDEASAFETDPRHHNFSAREMLRRIVQHKAGEAVTLRDDDGHFHEILEDSGLIDLSKEGEQTTVTRTDAQAPAKPIEALTFRMEQIHEIRMKLMMQKPAKKTE